MRKIHCEEITLETPVEKFSMEEVREMIGFYEPADDFKKTGNWEVTMIEGGWTASSQFEAQMVASLEEIKALLLRLIGSKK